MLHCPCLLRSVCKLYITSYNTDRERLDRLFINNSQIFILPHCPLFITNLHRPPSGALAQPVPKQMPIRVGSQSSVFPPTSPNQFLLSTLHHLVIQIFFIRLVATLRRKDQPVVEKWLSLIRCSQSGSLTSWILLYLLIRTRPRRVIRDSTPHGICSKPDCSKVAVFL